MATWILRTLSDGTKKMEKVPPTSEEIEEKRKIHEEYLQNRKLYQEQKEKQEFPIDEFSEIAEEKRLKMEFFKSIKESIRFDGSCWTWIGNNKEYETIKKKAYELFKKKLDNDSDIIHKCDNTKCINPNHLYTSMNRELNLR